MHGNQKYYMQITYNILNSLDAKSCIQLYSKAAKVGRGTFGKSSMQKAKSQECF